MQRQRTFVWTNNPQYGFGWIPENAAPGWFPGPGFLTAHDTMEHLSSKTDWAHELRATGVGVFGVLGVPGRSQRTIADDVVGFAARDHRFEVPPAPARWAKPLKDADHEAVIQRFGDRLRDQIATGMKRAQEAGAKVPGEAKRRAPFFVDAALPWIRLGYAAAQRLYGHDEGVATGKLLERVKDAINTNHDELMPLNGEKLSVCVDTKAKTFEIKRLNTRPVKGNGARRVLAMTENLDALFA